MVWSALTSGIVRLLDWRDSVIYEQEEINAKHDDGFPLIHIHATVHNRSAAPIYAYQFDVIGDDMLNIAAGTPKAHQLSPGDRRETSFSMPECLIAPGTNTSFDFILYPNWQKWALGLDSAQQQSGLRRQEAGIVATFQTCLRLRSKALRRIPNVTTRTISIKSKTAIDNATIVEKKYGDAALTHWVKPDTETS